MAYIRHKRYKELFRPGDGAVWWAFVPNPNKGKALRESTGHRDDVAAHQWYLDRIRSGNGRPVQTEAAEGKQRTLREALGARIEWLKAARKNDDKTRKKLSEKTIQFYQEKGKPLLDVLGRDTPLSQLDHERVRQYIITRSESAKATTIGKELTALSMAMRLARKDGYACPDFRDIKPVDFATTYVPKERWLSEAEVDDLIEVLPLKRGAVVAFIVATSATYPSEVAPVTRAMIDAKKYVVHVPGTKREARNRRLVVPSHARKYLDYALRHASGSGLFLFEPWHSVRRDLHVAAKLLSKCPTCRQANVAWARHEVGAIKPDQSKACRLCKTTPPFPPLSPNDLRRTFAQWLVRSGVPYELAYPLMGHSSPRMLQQVYGKRDATAVADLIELALKKAPKGARKRAG